MSFLGDLIEIADDVTKDFDLQCQVTLYPWIAQDVHGDDTYGTPVTLTCVVDRTNRILYQGGQQITVVATLTFVGDVAPNGAAGRREPIDPRDKIVLPDGFTGPIVSTPDGVTDPGTGRGFIQSVMLGAR